MNTSIAHTTFVIIYGHHATEINQVVLGNRSRKVPAGHSDSFSVTN